MRLIHYIYEVQFIDKQEYDHFVYRLSNASNDIESGIKLIDTFDKSLFVSFRSVKQQNMVLICEFDSYRCKRVISI